MERIISQQTIDRRNSWITKILELSGDFGSNINELEKELTEEIQNQGLQILLGHLRLCGNIPECYKHDSTAEKLYSKYTDILLSKAFNALGIKSLVLTERADSADVEAYGKKFSFVADAKAFRLSRTAKNQKDFKVQAMDNWKKGKSYAMIVCPIYQLPKRTSQIYQQATSRNVCIFTYSHLSLLVNYSRTYDAFKAEKLLHKIFKIIPALNPSKNAIDYWLAVNQTILNDSQTMDALWKMEKLAAVETIKIGKQEALRFLAKQREKIMNMSHQEALGELIRMSKIDNKVKTIRTISDNGLFEIK